MFLFAPEELKELGSKFDEFRSKWNLTPSSSEKLAKRMMDEAIVSKLVDRRGTAPRSIRVQAERAAFCAALELVPRE